MKVLDTNFVIDFIHGTKKSKVKMEMIKNEPLMISEATVIELLAGAYNSDAPSSEIQKINEMLSELNIIKVDHSAREQTCAVYAYLESKNIMIDKFDIAIAGTALTLGAPIVTNNGDFDRLRDQFSLGVENWLSP